mmetsp:Transcript_54785/g.153674  ORF Transcript_54785/g.153674 Transcript_54785/m.153674 type:complete len:414 (+) Transcript_54785:67-1308(+)
MSATAQPYVVGQPQSQYITAQSQPVYMSGHPHRHYVTHSGSPAATCAAPATTAYTTAPSTAACALPAQMSYAGQVTTTYGAAPNQGIAYAAPSGYSMEGQAYVQGAPQEPGRGMYEGMDPNHGGVEFGQAYQAPPTAHAVSYAVAPAIRASAGAVSYAQSHVTYAAQQTTPPPFTSTMPSGTEAQPVAYASAAGPSSVSYVRQPDGSYSIVPSVGAAPSAQYIAQPQPRAVTGQPNVAYGQPAPAYAQYAPQHAPPPQGSSVAAALPGAYGQPQAHFSMGSDSGYMPQPSLYTGAPSYQQPGMEFQHYQQLLPQDFAASMHGHPMPQQPFGGQFTFQQQVQGLHGAPSMVAHMPFPMTADAPSPDMQAPQDNMVAPTPSEGTAPAQPPIAPTGSRKVATKKFSVAAKKKKGCC